MVDVVIFVGGFGVGVLLVFCLAIYEINRLRRNESLYRERAIQQNARSGLAEYALKCQQSIDTEVALIVLMGVPNGDGWDGIAYGRHAVTLPPVD